MTDNLQQTTQGQPEKVPFEVVQHNLSDIKPTSAEIGNLWASYMAESMSVCFLKDYVSKSKDTDIHSVLQRALDVSSQRIQTMENIFTSINHPIPEAYGEKDVDSNTNQLFSEAFTLLYTRLMHKYVLLHYSNATTVSYRSDIVNCFNECMNTSQEIIQKASKVLLEKGLLSKSPTIVIPDRVDYVHDKDYFGGFFAKKRPLNALEIGHIFSLMEMKQLIRTLVLGYSQVVKSEKVKMHLSKAKQISDKQLEKLGAFLADEDIPQPTRTDNLVTESTESPLSDKLILSHVSVVTGYVLTACGIAITNTARMDIISTFRDSVTELLSLSKDAAELMIENGWLERVPETSDRRELIH